MKIKFRLQKYFSIALALSLFCGQTLISGFVVSASSDGAAYAQSQEQKKEKKKTRRTPAMRERTYKKLSEAQALADENKHAKALELLNAMKADTSSLNEYEVAMVWNFIGFVYSSQGKYKQALPAFTKILSLPNIPEALEQQTLFSVAQMHMAMDNPKQTIKYLKRYHGIASPTTQSLILLSQSYYLTEQYKPAVKYAEQAIELAKTQGGQPQEMWLLILRAGYYELGNTPRMIWALETLVRLYPKGDYFAQLAAMYGEQKKETKQLNVMEASYDGGYFSKQGEYLNLASLLMNSEVPYKAAKVLVDGMKKDVVEESITNLKMLAQAWVAAQEPRKSVRILKKAAKKADDGELYIRLGQSYMDMDEWTDCISSIRSGVKKGGLKRKDSAHITLGICYFNADKLDKAINEFKKAEKYKRSRKFAESWIEYLRSEQSRRRSIAESLI